MQKRLILKIIAALLISHFIIMIGKSNWVSIFADWRYYKDLAITFTSVFLVFEYVDRITRYLNKRYAWTTDLLSRTLLQVGLAVIIPSLMAVLLTYLQYEFIYDQDLAKTGYFGSEFPATILLIVIVNLVFVISFLLRTVNERNENVPSKLEDQEPIVLLGKKGSKSVPVMLEEVAFIKLRNGMPFLTSNNGDVSVLPENLDHYERHLPSTSFFRVNRQTIIHRFACNSFKAIENGKIEIFLKPNNEESVIVSQKRASKFRSWVKG